MTCCSWSYSYLLRLPVGISITTSTASSAGALTTGGGGSLRDVGVDRAHDPDPVAVGVAHDGVAGAPEGVVGLLLHRDALGDQRGHELVDLLAGVRP